MPTETIRTITDGGTENRKALSLKLVYLLYSSVQC